MGYEGKQFVAYWHFTGWDHLSLGLHVCTSIPNIEIHLPFGFIRAGRRSAYELELIDEIGFGAFMAMMDRFKARTQS